MALIVRSQILFIVLLALWCLSMEAQARELSLSDTRQIGHCIKVASHGALWLERTLWGVRDQEGGWIGAEVHNADGSHDLGPFQINSWWVTRIAKAMRRSDALVRRWLIYDACFNARIAQFILVTELERRHDFWLGVGAYHSPTPWRQRRYARSVANHLIRRFGHDVFSPKMSDGRPVRSDQAHALMREKE